MIRSIAMVSSGHAKSYFTSALQPTEYYVNQQELRGRFHGRLAERLGIAGPTDRDTFFALCDNKHPISGAALTPRNKDHRVVGWDVSFHCPKGVSLAAVLSKDSHITDAFQESVHETMKEMERDFMTRVRKNKKDEDRYTGEMVYGAFLHQTARPAKGAISDPHIHQHNVILNVTWDDKEKQFKAAHCREINRSMPYFQARFHKRFADKLMGLGYKIKTTSKGWDIDGVPNEIVALFSKRANEIGIFAAENNITNPKALDKLGAKTRGKKNKDWSMTELKAEWRRQIREASAGKAQQAETVIRHNHKIISPALSAQQAVDHAAKDRFERVSTISDRRLLESAYRYALGNNSVSIDEITSAFEQDDTFIHVKDGYQNICTKKEVLLEEREMVNLARNGQGRFNPLYAKLPPINLDGQQRNAIEHILGTSNFVSIVRGVAGSGKTTTLTELDKHLKAAGKEPFYFAPTGQAARDNLAKEGFINAETIARLLVDENLQGQIKNQIVIVDEAGMMGAADLKQLLSICASQKARVVLIGDERQHNSVSRGDGLRILGTVGQIKSATIDKIRRQRGEKYRAAVQDLADGKVKSAFDKLDNIEAIRQIDPMHPNAELVKDYVAAVKKGKSTLIISPTHKQGNSVTEEVRMQLQAANLLGKKETEALKLSSLNLSEAQREDWRNYRAGQVIQFNLPAPQIRRGSVWSIDNVNGGQVTIQNKAGQTKLLPLNKANAFDLFEKSDIKLAKGDKIRITKGSFDHNKKRLENGKMLEVIAFTKSQIKLRNSESKATYLINSDFGHLDHAYCTTSHSSQGKTCDEVFISQPASTFAATDARQIYVSVSRGRDSCKIYTDDKEELLAHAQRTGDRLSALELLARSKTKHPSLSLEPGRITKPERNANPHIEKNSIKTKRHLDYEP